MDVDFSGKRALVTGAAGGIGTAVVAKLTDCGAQILALDNNESGLAALKKKFPDIEVLCVDLMDWEATRRAAETCPYVDLLVNNAGILTVQNVGMIDEASFDRIMGINLKAVVNLSQVIGERMKAANKSGAIVNVSSAASGKATKGYMMYSASKAGLNMVTKSLAVELGPHKIRVNAVCPTCVNTELWNKICTEEILEIAINSIPLGRIAEPEDVAESIVYLLSDRAAMINGALLTVDGGSTIR